MSTGLSRFVLLSTLLLATSWTAFPALAKQAPVASPVADQVPVMVVLDQRELLVPPANTGAAVGSQFGLLGAIIGAAVDNSANKKNETAVMPVRNELLGYDFAGKVEAALRARLPSPGFSSSPQFHFFNNAPDAVKTPFPLPSRFVSITPSYVMDSSFSQLEVVMSVSVKDGETKSNGKQKFKIAYMRDFRFRYRLKNPGEFQVASWTRIGGARMGAMLDEAINQTVDMIVYDFSAEGRALWPLNHNKETTRVQNIGYPGRDVRHGDQWAWIRSGKQPMYQSMLGVHPINVDSAMQLSFPLVATHAGATPASASTPVAAASASAAPATEVADVANAPATAAATEADAGGNAPASSAAPESAPEQAAAPPAAPADAGAPGAP
ncbi:MAG TPA: hypothetical protein VM469_09565 [Pseudoxanthomonas sp.]|nr:hypothetical protein [Pseudoxanthomonas sp.]